ncbi:MAG TPA: N-methyl-L-tryptophan oxidase [Chitinophagaceae bacterium]|nr:N-methyl-L-tryptophan oxidase [Chitinophagaceae bacterium]
MSEDKYDVIIIGVGSMGSSACFHLASRGYKVLGLEQFDTVPHDEGSHSGQSRIIRKAYFEHSDYVPLLNRAYENWQQLEQLTGRQVYFQIGLLYVGPHDHEVIRGVKSAADKYGILLESLSAKQQEKFSPHFHLSTADEMLFEPDAGFLLPEKIISLYIQEAIKKGAVIKTGEKVLEWKKENAVLKVLTHKGSYYTDKLILTAGAWTEQVIKQLSVPLKVTRQVVVWVEPADPAVFIPENFPCWLIAGENIRGAWYGFPYLSGLNFPGPTGLKFAKHYAAEQTEPGKVNRQVSEEEIKTLLNEAKKYFKPASNKVTAVKTCLYTNTWDEHFIIDHLPGYEDDVTIACGFSGHGFKFVSVVGEIVADLSTKGKTDLPIDFLGLKRFN